LEETQSLRVFKEVREYKGGLLLGADATGNDKLEIVHHAEMLLTARFKALKAPISECDLLRSCTSNMMDDGMWRRQERSIHHQR
jgi:hypothetical protein